MTESNGSTRDSRRRETKGVATGDHAEVEEILEDYYGSETEDSFLHELDAAFSASSDGIDDKSRQETITAVSLLATAGREIDKSTDGAGLGDGDDFQRLFVEVEERSQKVSSATVDEESTSTDDVLFSKEVEKLVSAAEGRTPGDSGFTTVPDVGFSDAKGAPDSANANPGEEKGSSLLSIAAVLIALLGAFFGSVAWWAASGLERKVQAIAEPNAPPESVAASRMGSETVIADAADMDAVEAEIARMARVIQEMSARLDRIDQTVVALSREPRDEQEKRDLDGQREQPARPAAPFKARPGATKALQSSTPVYVQAKKTAQPLQTLEPITTVSIVEVQGNWWRVRVPGGLEGWVSSAYLDINDDDARATGYVNVRLLPEVSEQAVPFGEPLAPGEAVKIIENVPGWVRVKLPDRFTAWIPQEEN